MNNGHIWAFPPILGKRPKVLVLGSMPSEESLKKKRYYGHPRNQFWPLIYKILGAGEPPEEYERRVRFLEEQRVAVWDVFAQCRREGSLDRNIAEEEYRDIAAFIWENPSITLIALNGTKAEKGFLRGLEVHGRVQNRSELGRSTAAKSKYVTNKTKDKRAMAAEELGVEIIRLPSTSPIPTKRYRRLEDKLEAWSIVAEYAVTEKTEEELL